MVPYTYKALVTRVVDGDTFDARVDLGFTVSVDVRFRLADIDTPESYRPSSEEERIHGEAATHFVKTLIEGKEITINSAKTGKYGRWVASVTLPDGRNLTELLIKEGFEKKESYE